MPLKALLVLPLLLVLPVQATYQPAAYPPPYVADNGYEASTTPSAGSEYEIQPPPPMIYHNSSSVLGEAMSAPVSVSTAVTTATVTDLQVQMLHETVTTEHTVLSHVTVVSEVSVLQHDTETVTEQDVQYVPMTVVEMAPPATETATVHMVETETVVADNPIVADAKTVHVTHTIYAGSAAVATETVQLVSTATLIVSGAPVRQPPAECITMSAPGQQPPAQKPVPSAITMSAPGGQPPAPPPPGPPATLTPVVTSGTANAACKCHCLCPVSAGSRSTRLVVLILDIVRADGQLFAVLWIYDDTGSRAASYHVIIVHRIHVYVYARTLIVQHQHLDFEYGFLEHVYIFIYLHVDVYIYVVSCTYNVHDDDDNVNVNIDEHIYYIYIYININACGSTGPNDNDPWRSSRQHRDPSRPCATEDHNGNRDREPRIRGRINAAAAAYNVTEHGRGYHHPYWAVVYPSF
ncbi:hypothetical protein ABW21_db0206623 [Orbilia brochopaga]|nr:hypothetical protein ABW21_db0206623 [Drechslerella brochopaga]